MISRDLVRASLLLAVLSCSPGVSAAFDPNETFKKGTFVLSAEGGGGVQNGIDEHREPGLEFWNAGVRFSLLPFGPSFSGGPFYGALEVGLEPYYQRYEKPVHAFYGGLGLMLRYHVLSLGRFVPYLEVFSAVGGTDLKREELNSTFAFLLHGGAGASFFVTDTVALYAGYRLEHVSNGNTSKPNRGFESHTGVAGVSFFFP